MLENITWIKKALVGVAGVNLALAIGVGAGAVPRPGDNHQVETASVSQVEEVAAPAARQPGDGAPAAVQAAVQSQSPSPTVAPTTTAPKATPTTKAPAPKTTTAPKATATTAAPVVAAAPAPTTTVPAKVARRTPSATEVQNAINQLKTQVGGLLLLVSPTPDQIAQAGDQICTAFDNGQSFAQVKATGLSMIPASITVSPATVDWAVRQAVTMYCPGHLSKLA